MIFFNFVRSGFANAHADPMLLVLVFWRPSCICIILAPSYSTTTILHLLYRTSREYNVGFLLLLKGQFQYVNAA